MAKNASGGVAPPPKGGAPPLGGGSGHYKMYKLYILKSRANNRYYVGHSSDIEKRLVQHNNGEVKSTKPYAPWDIVYSEAFSDKHSAYKREMQVKSYHGGRAFKALIEDGGVA